MEAYLASKQNAQQQTRLSQQDAIAAEGRANAEKDRVGNLMLSGTPDPRMIASNPGLMPGPGQIQAQGPSLPGQPAPQSSLIDTINKFISERDAKKSMASQEQTLGMKKTQAEIDALGRKDRGGVAAIDLKDKAAIEGRLYDDYRNAQPVKNLVLVRDAVRNIAALSKSKTGIADIGIVYSLVKVLDPASAVKEGEITLSQSANPAAQKIADAWNNAAKGRLGNDEKNKQILSAARAIYKETERGANMERDAVSKRGNQYQINPDIAFPQWGIPQKEFDAMEGGGQQTPESIRAEFQAGRITREQAKASIAALRGGANGRP